MAINKFNARLMIYNDADDATISQTVGEQVPTLPVDFLQVYSHSRIWRTLNIAQAQLTLTWQMPRLISGVALSRHNMSKSSKFRVEVFSDESATQLVYDSIVDHPNHIPAVFQKTLGELEWLVDALVATAVNTKLQDVEHWFDLTLAQAVRITVFDPDNEYGHIDVDRLYVGRALQPSINISYGYKAGWSDNTETKRSAGGTKWGQKTTKKRLFSFTLGWLSEADRPHFYNAIQRVDVTDDWYLSLFPLRGGQKERHYAMAAIFEELPDLTGDTASWFSTEFNVGEA